MRKIGDIILMLNKFKYLCATTYQNLHEQRFQPISSVTDGDCFDDFVYDLQAAELPSTTGWSNTGLF